MFCFPTTPGCICTQLGWDRWVLLQTAGMGHNRPICPQVSSNSFGIRSRELSVRFSRLEAKILETPASSLSALFYPFELARPRVDYEGLVDTIIAGVERLAALGALLSDDGKILATRLEGDDDPVGVIQDPVLALITERTRLGAECEIESDETIGGEARDARVSETNEVTHVLDERIVDMVGASPAGLIAQVDLLVATGLVDQPQPIDDDLVDRLAASIVAGIKALAAPADDSKILSLFREWVDLKRLS
jgi:hypothetical protein